MAVQNSLFDRCLRLEGDAAAAVAGLVRTLPPDIAVEQAGARCSVGLGPICPDEVDAVACP